jgi:hypothetical protein
MLMEKKAGGVCSAARASHPRRGALVDMVEWEVAVERAEVDRSDMMGLRRYKT